ncbi:LemA family protein [Undibacterium jejuense]|uniref:LemA family protein n=1 Tax=Undibacterium jejuense TaxID=1344949 RepID=A0A923HJ93_9BURK|nr:LemA family protein [Undibacterium jejuense]MBC3862742.1 LemA family protein [Undibacterium jejuense]
MITLIVFLAIVALIVFWVIGVYNRLVTLRNRFKNAFAQIDVQLKRRYDLIPNLVEVAKGYMKHERETLEAVIAARNQAVSASSKAGLDPADAASVQQLSAAEGTLTASLGKMFALSESYPDLKANENMIQLTEELTSTENKIAFARQAYNDSVMQYNTGIEQFPGSLIANNFGFKNAELLQATESAEERKAVKVSF